MSEIPELKVRLKDFADVVNAFKSEAVQPERKLVEIIEQLKREGRV
jgi:hypothetical protein